MKTLTDFLLCVLIALPSCLSAQKARDLSAKDILIDQNIICFSAPGDVIVDFGSPHKASYLANQTINAQDSLVESGFSSIVLDYESYSFYFVQLENSQPLYRVELNDDSHSVNIADDLNLKVGFLLKNISSNINPYLSPADRRKIVSSKEDFSVVIKALEELSEDKTAAAIKIKADAQGAIKSIIVFIMYNE